MCERLVRDVGGAVDVGDNAAVIVPGWGEAGAVVAVDIAVAAA